MSITRAEAARLVTLAATWDNRTIGEAVAAAWFDSGNLARWTYEEAVDAIRDYYATTTDAKPWVMPSHITTRIRSVREDQTMRQTAAEMIETAADPKMLAIVESYAAKFEIPAQFRPAGADAALQVACPHCGSLPGDRCFRAARAGRTTVDSHPSRIELAEQKDGVL